MNLYNLLLINCEVSIRELLQKIEENTRIVSFEKPNLFLVDNNGRVVGSLSDGDIRRALIKGYSIESKGKEIMNVNFHYLNDDNFSTETILKFKKLQIKLVPRLDKNFKLLEIVDLNNYKGVVPVSCLIMAGGMGERLRPLTDELPKPLIPLAGKPILERNIERLKQYNINDICLSVRYKSEKIKDHFADGSSRGVNIRYIQEENPLGTIGALSLMGEPAHDTVLVMNSDLLTNIDFLDFFEFFQSSNAAMAVATVPYNINVPYAILETNDKSEVRSFVEKPNYVYYSNAGIYLMKKELLKFVPKGEKMDATDLMQVVLNNNLRLLSFPILGYWLDIGNHKDYQRAKEDIKHIQF